MNACFTFHWLVQICFFAFFIRFPLFRLNIREKKEPTHSWGTVVPGVNTRLLTRRSRVQIPPQPLILLKSNHQFSSRQSEQKKRRTLSLIAEIWAVAVGEREKRRRKEKGGSNWIQPSTYVAPSDNISVILSVVIESWNIEILDGRKRNQPTTGSSH